MVGVQCQATTQDNSEPQQVECSFDSRIQYPENCTDFQIRIRCECGEHKYFYLLIPHVIENVLSILIALTYLNQCGKWLLTSFAQHLQSSINSSNY